MLPHKHPILKIAVALGCLATGIFLLTKYQNPSVTNTNAVAAGVIVPPSPTPLPKDESEMHASDGSKTLIERTQTASDGSKTFTFSVANVDQSDATQIFTRTLPAGGSISMPYNAWAPDNKTVFLDQFDGTAHEYLVVKASGEPWTEQEHVLEIASLWNQKKVPYTLDTATGWASETLVILTTKKDDGTKGPNYWFDIPSRSFLILAS